MFVGPGQTEDQIQTDRRFRSHQHDDLDRPRWRSRSIRRVAIANFVNNPNNRIYQPRAYANDYTIPERIWQYTASVQQDLGAQHRPDGRVHRQPGTQPVPPQRRPTRSRRSSRTRTRPTRRIVIRAVLDRPSGMPPATSPACRTRTPRSTTRPAAATTTTTRCSSALSRRSASGLSMNAQYTLSRSFGNTSGSNEALTAGNNARNLADFDYDNGYNNFDVRHTFNFSAALSGSVRPRPQHGRERRRGLRARRLGRRRHLQRAQRPADRRAHHAPRHRLQWTAPATSSTTRRPAAWPSSTRRAAATRATCAGRIWCPASIRSSTTTALLFLNPAAFATPAPGTFGNLERNSLHGPSFTQVDMVHRRSTSAAARNVEFRAEIFNLFNTANFSNPIATLPNALPTAATTEANKVQPGQAFTPQRPARSAR